MPVRGDDTTSLRFENLPPGVEVRDTADMVLTVTRENRETRSFRAACDCGHDFVIAEDGWGVSCYTCGAIWEPI